MVCELVTDALKVSSEAEYVVVRVHIDTGEPTIEVWDRADEPAVVKVAGLTEEEGRGMFHHRSALLPPEWLHNERFTAAAAPQVFEPTPLLLTTTGGPAARAPLRTTGLR
ncbi:MAG: hypothetical protein JWN52_6261 [Actinomycetia bacterium]|nr:hypothetical protein [Actinomycetes bacterium]